MDGKYLAVDEAARALGVSRATAWNWIRRYGLQTYRLPGERRTLLRREDVARLAEPVPAAQARATRSERA